MSESHPENTPVTNGATPQPQAEEAVPSFQIRRVYLKDFSLEQPNSPDIFLGKIDSPELAMDMRVQANPIPDSPLFEVVVMLELKTAVKGQTLFLIEAHQAGLFELSNIPTEQVGPILGITCPHILYPYLRANVADAINKAGFPTVHLEEVNFQAIYQEKVAQAEAESSSNGGAAPKAK